MYMYCVFSPVLMLATFKQGDSGYITDRCKEETIICIKKDSNLFMSHFYYSDSIIILVLVIIIKDITSSVDIF